MNLKSHTKKQLMAMVESQSELIAAQITRIAEMQQTRIVQMLITPNDNTYQGALFGLGSDGVIYIALYGKWNVYQPCEFKEGYEAG